jgi:serine/threonine protein kinase
MPHGDRNMKEELLIVKRFKAAADWQTDEILAAVRALIVAVTGNYRTRIESLILPGTDLWKFYGVFGSHVLSLLLNLPPGSTVEITELEVAKSCATVGLNWAVNGKVSTVWLEKSDGAWRVADIYPMGLAQALSSKTYGQEVLELYRGNQRLQVECDDQRLRPFLESAYEESYNRTDSIFHLAEHLTERKQFWEYLNLQGYCLERLFCRTPNNEIYKGTCGLDGKPVAVKKLRSNDPDPRKRFLREIEILHLLSDDPNVVRVKLSGDWRGSLFHICEWLERHTELYKIITDITWQLREKLSIMADVAKIVARLHSYNIAHRDVTPDHIFVSESGEVRLIDFGMAGFLDRQEPEERNRYILTDVYDFGLSLCQLLLETSDFNYGDTSIYAREWNDALERLGKSHIDGDLLLIVERAFYANPEIRPVPDHVGPPYRDMREPATALARYVGNL